MKKIIAEIVENKQVAPGYYRMRVESAYLGCSTGSGQFVEVKCSEGTGTLLRRPLSVHRVNKSGIELLYEAVGKGTELLAQKKRGEVLDVIGPLGTGFETKSIVHSPRSIVLVAGGIGVAPLVALAEALVHSPQSMVHGKKRKVYALVGAKTKNHILCRKDFKKIGINVIVSTEDGSLGKKGFITDCLKALLWTMDCGLWTIYACGPTPMLKAVADIARAHHISCQVSLEERMACGVGVCLGCPVRVKKVFTNDQVRSAAEPPRRGRPTTNDKIGYKMVCKDGPIFNAEEIAW